MYYQGAIMQNKTKNTFTNSKLHLDEKKTQRKQNVNLQKLKHAIWYKKMN